MGKELFIKNAFASYCEDNDLPVNCCPPETTADAFLRNASDFCTDIALELQDSQSKIHYLIQVSKLMPHSHIFSKSKLCRKICDTAAGDPSRDL